MTLSRRMRHTRRTRKRVNKKSRGRRGGAVSGASAPARSASAASTVSAPARSASAASTVSAPVSNREVSLYFNLNGGSNSTAVQLIAYSPNAANLLDSSKLISSGWGLKTGNGIYFNKDKIQFPFTVSKVINNFSCSSWLNNTWKPASFLNAPTISTAAFLLTRKVGATYKTTPQTPLPASLDLNNIIVTNLWTGLNLSMNNPPKRTNPPSGSTVLLPGTQVNVKISFYV
jgi:hypothetical protein